MFWLVEARHVDPRRYVQIGLRGYRPGEVEFASQAERGNHDLLHARGARARDR
jgi:agmatinase